MTDAKKANDQLAKQYQDKIAAQLQSKHIDIQQLLLPSEETGFRDFLTNLRDLKLEGFPDSKEKAQPIQHQGLELLFYQLKKDLPKKTTTPMPDAKAERKTTAAEEKTKNSVK